MQECNDWLPKLFGYLFLGVIVWFTGQDRTGAQQSLDFPCNFGKNSTLDCHKVSSIFGGIL